MDEVTLKRGRGSINLVKSPDLIALKPSSQGSVSEALTTAPVEINETDVGSSLDGFTIVKVNGDKQKMEDVLDRVRGHFMVDAGSHVYHTPNSSAPIVPTGKITLRFDPASSEETRQQIIDEHRLEIVDSSVKNNEDGTQTETYTVKTTPGSTNPLKIAADLQQDESVALAEPDLATPGRLYAFQLPTDLFLNDQWHLRNSGKQFGTTLGLKAGADARVVDAWQRLQSLGAPNCVVAIIDDGFDLSHPDLSGNSKIVAPWDFASNTNNPTPRRFNPDSRLGDYHGTACAGVALGNATGGNIVGAAPHCRFMPLRWSASLSDDSIKKWFGYAASNGAWVVSCSWGAAADSFTLSTVMDEAITECATSGRNGLGCVVVFAAGNSSHDINDPAGGTVDGFATHPDVIAVAACTSRDERSSYSNFGREISVCAPSNGTGGRGILTSDVRGTFQFQGAMFEAGYDAGDYTKTFGGTSSATPLVAGICALLLSANPSLTAKQVKAILEQTARRIGQAADYDQNGHSIFFGHGCVNADAAVARAQALLNPLNPFVAVTGSSNGESNGDGTETSTSLLADEFWGPSRHALIARVAEGKLTAAAKARIRAILGDDVHLDDIANWADQIKGARASEGQDEDTYRFLTDFPNDASRDWHYIDLPHGITSYQQAEQLGFIEAEGVVQMINETVRILQGNPGRMSEVNALRWLVHLVGDVHQPLHVGCGFIDATGDLPRLESNPVVIRQRDFRSDRGGNALLLPISGNPTLHGYWDSRVPGNIDNAPAPNFVAAQPGVAVGIIAPAAPASAAETSFAKLSVLANVIAENEKNMAVARAVRPAPASVLPPERWAEDWAMISLRKSAEAYRNIAITARQGNKFKVSWEGKQNYDNRCKPIVSERLASAALNLAKLLNEIF